MSGVIKPRYILKKNGIYQQAKQHQKTWKSTEDNWREEKLPHDIQLSQEHSWEDRFFIVKVYNQQEGQIRICLKTKTKKNVQQMMCLLMGCIRMNCQV